MRKIDISDECLEFIDNQSERFVIKFFYLIRIMEEVKVINSKYIKKLQSTAFYELRISVENEYRVIIFAFDNQNFAESKKVVCLCGFQKKSTKDYKREIAKAEIILHEYLKN